MRPAKQTAITPKLLIVSFDYAPAIGGQGIYVQKLKTHLPGCSLLVASGEPAADVHVLKTGFLKGFGPLLFSLKASRALEKEIASTKADVVHVQTGPGGAYLSKKPNIPLIATMHNCYRFSARHKRSLLMRPYYAFMQRKERAFLHRCDHIIAISRMLADELIDGYGIDPRKITVLYNPIGDEFTPQDEKKSGAVLFVGRIEKQKGIRELLEAIKGIPEQELWIAGKGDDEDFANTYILENELGDRVKMLGPIPHEELPMYYSKAALTVMPSHFDTFGLVAMESLACGTPCIVSDTSGAAEIVRKVDKTLVIEDILPHVIKHAITHALAKIGKGALRIDLSRTGIMDWTDYAQTLLRIAEGERNHEQNHGH